MTRSPLPALLGVLVLLAPGVVRAHAIESSLERLGDLRAGLDAAQAGRGGVSERLRLETRFSSGEPVGEAEVRLVPPGAGQPIALGRTDADGRLTFVLPAQAGRDWEIQVDGGPGHRDYLELPAQGRSGSSDHAHAPWNPAVLASGLSPLLLLGLLGGLGWRIRPSRRR